MTSEPNYRPLVIALAFSALALFASWKLGLTGEADPVYIPTFFDQIRPGLTVAELEALGARPYDKDAPGGPLQLEFGGDIDCKKGGMQVVYGDPFLATSRFERGQLVEFELRTSDNYAGAEVDHADLLALVPVLAEAKMLRRGYTEEDLVDALGRGIRVARVVDAAHGAVDVYRWDVEAQGRRAARFEASVANGQVVDHRLTP